MRSKVQLLLIAIVTICVLGTWTVYSQRRQTQRWEYRFVEYERGPRAQTEINKLAADGWELITVENVVNSDLYLYFLKRQLS